MNFVKGNPLRFAALILLMLWSVPGQEDSPPLTAQNLHRWGTITLFNGLPSDSVRAISQTPDGNLWFGTDNGLARFDGRRIQVFPFESADSNRITALETAEDGSLWIGTFDGCFRYSSRSFERIPETEGETITSISLGSTPFLGTADGEILKVSAGNERELSIERFFKSNFKTANGEPLQISAMFQTGNKLYAATNGRGTLVFIDGKLREDGGLSSPEVVSVIRNTESGLLLGSTARRSDSGLFAAASDSPAELITGPTGSVLSARFDRKGDLWVGSESNGLFRFRNGELTDHFTFSNTSGNLRSDTVYDVFVDREGVVWSGTAKGISRFDPSSPFHQVLSDDANSNFIRTFYRTSDGRVLAGSNRGLFVNESGGWISVPGFEDRAIYAIHENDDGGLIAGTPDGIVDEGGEVLIEGDIRAIVTAGGKTFAADFDSGLIEFSGEVSRTVARVDSPTALTRSENSLLIGTAREGVFSFSGSVLTPATTPREVEGAVWKIVAGEGGGHSIATSRGLFSDTKSLPASLAGGLDVRDVVVQGDEIWAATSDAGLLHVRLDPDFGPLISRINIEKGLPSDRAFALLPTDEGILVGTNRGIVTYKPGGEAPKINPVRILSQRLHELSEIDSVIALDYPQNSLLTEFAGQSSRTFPEEFQYAYVLKDARGKVIDRRVTGEQQYSPANLSPGEYSVEASVFDRDLLASEPIVIRFSIGKEPFPWTATTLGALLVFAIAALIWAIVEHRRIRARNRQLAEARLDLANEAERERKRIARDLHDQTLADLRTLMMKSDKLAEGGPGLREDIEAVSTDIRRICEDLSPSVLENVGLVAALEFLLDQTVENKKFSADDDAEDRIAFPIEVQLQVYRIAQEVLTNIARHSNAAEVAMEVRAGNNGGFELLIRDDGDHFDPAGGTGSGRGIANIRSRANIIRAKAGWENLSVGGNLFTLRIGERKDD